MTNLSRRWIAVGALLAAIAVGLGAYGAHGLKDTLSRAGFAGDDLIRRLGIFETAVRYQMFHSIALVLTGLALQHRPCSCWRFAAWAFLLGIILFCGLLKVLTFADPKWNWLGAVVPIGGVAMIAGWLSLAVGALRKT
ncbi:MAG TPA: DUF423 domain-containing protein [Lacipirellulaceae bacterium]|nr:DUF423 domain-containing protein [Lacipirellulaceae bacterium]